MNVMTPPRTVRQRCHRRFWRLLMRGAVLHGPHDVHLERRRRRRPHQGVDLTLPLDQVADGHRAMDERRAIKTLLTV